MATPLSTRPIAEDEARAIVEAVAHLSNRAAWPAVIELLRRPKPPGGYRMSMPRANFLRDKQIWPMRVAMRKAAPEDPEARAIRLAQRRAELAMADRPVLDRVAAAPVMVPPPGSHQWRPEALGVLVSEPVRYEPPPDSAPPVEWGEELWGVRR